MTFGLAHGALTVGMQMKLWATRDGCNISGYTKRGREFTAPDDEYSPLVAIVNQTFVHNFFPNQDVLSQRVRFNSGKRELEIVGVVADAKYRSQASLLDWLYAEKDLLHPGNRKLWRLQK